MKKVLNFLKAFTLLCFLSIFTLEAQQTKISSVETSVKQSTARAMVDSDKESAWSVDSKQLNSNQWIMLTLATPGDVREVVIRSKGAAIADLKEALSFYITYDPMNLGEAVKYDAINEGPDNFKFNFKPKYGAHIRINIAASAKLKSLSISDITVQLAEVGKDVSDIPLADRLYMNPDMPVDVRVDDLLSIMTTRDKMELLREGWGIPGIPHLGVPAITKVEAIHGFSYGSGATVFPQSIGQGATWNKKLVHKMAAIIGAETKSANAVQAWSPVLDVAQDARWGRCEETYGEDPVLVSEIGGAWIRGFQSQGLLTTPKHFGGHGAPLGGRDSHDIGLSEREMREIHLAPFRDVIKKYNCQSIMMAYSDYLGVPIAKSEEILKLILRDEWGFEGFIVSDCGAIGNLTSRKHYTAKDKVEAARQALAAGIATNCGDTYNDPEVIEAAVRGELNMDDLDYTCKTLLATLFRNGLFESNPCKPLDWDKIYPGWNSDEHKEVARQVARESIVLLENKNDILPLSNSLNSIAVIGPGADDLQPGDYTQKVLPNQLQSVLTGIKATVDKGTKVVYERGCEFTGSKETEIDKAVAAAMKADVAVLVLGDCSTSEGRNDVYKTSGENHDYATLILPGDQQKLLEAVCETGKPVILILQVGRPYNVSYAAENCAAILVNWLPGQEGGHATADVLFGKYNPAGRLPMTFPRHVGQLPHYYNFKTSGRRYEYSDMVYYPLYHFGYGKSYTTFEYSDLKITENNEGELSVSASVKNTGSKAGDEVVQLYVTDMYASVRTRVMELKDFDRINLQPGESKTVNFELTPYQLSLLNDNMDRVVEKGMFKIMVGGCSPMYVASDRIKDSVGFETSREGLNGEYDYTKSFAADFDISIASVEKTDNKHIATVVVKNKGNITDTGKISLFVDNQKAVGKNRHYELDPGQETTIDFTIDKEDFKTINFMSKYKNVVYQAK